MEILLDVWREACRHIEITESAERIVRIISPQIPADLLIVRRLDLEHRRLETVTIGRAGGTDKAERVVTGRDSGASSRTDLSAAQLRAVLDWAARTEVSGSGAARDDVLALVASPDARGDRLAGPLRTDSGVIGILVASTLRG